MQPCPAAPSDPLHFWADVASIATGIIAVLAYVQFGLRRLRQRWRLEKYLKKEAPALPEDGDTGARTPLRLVAAVGMTEAEIMDAAFRSKHINLLTAADPDTGRAAAILLRYE